MLAYFGDPPFALGCTINGGRDLVIAPPPAWFAGEVVMTPVIVKNRYSGFQMNQFNMNNGSRTKGPSSMRRNMSQQRVAMRM
jgi:hypothetical protein